MSENLPAGAQPALPEVKSTTHARFVSDLRASLAFYVDLAGFPLLAIFPSPDEPAGAILRLSEGCALELLQQQPSTRSHPSLDHVILHMSGVEAGEAIVRRFEDRGVMPVPPVNPFWQDRGRAFADPDGAQLVIVIGEPG
jgi:catechol 2,3-dioxygenase-like lactoylglutathione lyase family enzyme